MFECNVCCNKIFRRNSDLIRHLKMRKYTFARKLFYYLDNLNSTEIFCKCSSCVFHYPLRQSTLVQNSLEENIIPEINNNFGCKLQYKLNNIISSYNLNIIIPVDADDLFAFQETYDIYNLIKVVQCLNL